MATSNDAVIHHKLGLHARPAAMFVKTAAQFSSRITLENLSRGTQPVNAKSILSVLSAGVKKDEQIRITAEGTDEAAAVNALTELIASNFGEAEN
jgi:phosphotransferase system HPr (HPr) family protein